MRRALGATVALLALTGCVSAPEHSDWYRRTSPDGVALWCFDTYKRRGVATTCTQSPPPSAEGTPNQ